MLSAKNATKASRVRNYVRLSVGNGDSLLLLKVSRKCRTKCQGGTNRDDR